MRFVPIAIAHLALIRKLARNGTARSVREAAHITRAEMAGEIGVHETTIAKWEVGQRTPRGAAAERWFECLGRLAELDEMDK